MACPWRCLMLYSPVLIQIALCTMRSRIASAMMSPPSCRCHSLVASCVANAVLTAWIGNGVLDGFLEDESLFGEFLRTPVSDGGVEPLVVGPPHAVVGVMPQLLDRGVVVPVHELLLQQPVRRFDYGVVVGVALA